MYKVSRPLPTAAMLERCYSLRLFVVGGEHIAMAMVAHSGHCVYKVMPEKHTHPVI